MTDELHSRVIPPDDSTSVSGRTICAYAAVFNRWTPIHDQDGDYEERIAPGAFAAGLAQRGDRIFAVYHHGRNLDGTQSAENSVPYGTPVVSREDHRGWYTETRVNEGAAGDRLLEAARNKALRGQSFTGIFLRTTPPKPPGGYRRDPVTGRLPQVTRHEILPIEYGLTPMPAYPEAEVVGVRAESSHGGPAEYVRHDGEDVQCPACLKYNQDDAQYCDQCGAALPGWGQPYSKDDGEDVPCPSCGAFNESDAQFCDQCGRILPNSAYDAAQAASSTGTGRAAMMADMDETSSTPDGGPQAPVAPPDHGRMIGRHSHAHPSYAGPDANMDGVHEHDHSHYDDADHDHAHHVSTSGRTELRAVAVVADHFGIPLAEARQMSPQALKVLAAGIDDVHGPAQPSHERAGSSFDGSSWDAQKVWTAGVSSDDPAKFFAATCAGRRDGDPKLAKTWALPHHYHPGDAPNAEGVSAALGRFNQTEGLTNKDAAKAHLEAHERAIQSAKAKDKSATSSSGRKLELQGAASRVSAYPPSRSAGEQHEGDITMSDRPMSVEERAARLSEITARFNEIHAEFAGAALPDDVRAEWKSLQAERVEHETAISDATQRAEYLQSLAAANPDATVPGADSSYLPPPAAGTGYLPPRRSSNGTPPRPASRSGLGQRITNLWDLSEVRQQARSLDDMAELTRDRALRVLEQSQFPSERNQGDVQARIEQLLYTRDDKQGQLAARIVATGSPLYHRAFGKVLVGGRDSLTSEEEGAMKRALTIGTPASFGPGSYPVPYQVDPTVTLTSNGAINALRQISRTEQIVGREWLGVTSTGIVVTRGTEASQVADATLSPFAMNQPGVAADRVQAFVPFSVEVEQDWNGLLAEISMMLADAKDIEEAGSFLTGNGTAPNPQGILTGISGAPQQVLTATTAVTSISDVYNVETQMAPRFRAQSNWLASKGGYNSLRQLWTQVASAAGDPWVRPSAGTPAEFLGYPASENSNMATSATTSGNQIAVMGDFKQFLIVDRIGMSVELVPHLFQQTTAGTGVGMPTGQRGIYALWRNNSIVLVPNAFRYLQVR